MKRPVIKKIVLWSAVLGLSQIPFAFSADAVLIRKSGDVEVRAQGKKQFQKVSAGIQLFFGDTVQTLPGAKAQIVFNDGNTVLLKESTSAKLSARKNSVQIHIPNGEFLIGIKKKLSKKQSFKVRTPAAVAAVRGTLFWGMSDKDLNTTYVCFQSQLEITAQKETVILKAGDKVLIPYGSPPKKTETAYVPLEYLDTFAVDGSIEKLKEMAPKK